MIHGIGVLLDISIVATSQSAQQLNYVLSFDILQSLTMMKLICC